MSLRPRFRPGRLARAGWRGLSGAVMAIGLLATTSGLLLALTAAPVDAATVSCGSTLTATSLVPGDSGSCTFSYSETAASLGNPFTVTVDVDTTSTSGGGSSGSGTATEALLDGQSTGLQVSLTDAASNTFGVPTPTCTGTYPNASSCTGHDDDQAVPGTTGTTSWSDTFTISWTFPLSAGNPYQGGSGTVTVTPYYNGTPAPSPSPSPTSSVLGISVSPSPTVAGSAVSTPSTGAGPSTPSLVLVAIGMVLVFFGLLGIGLAGRRRQAGQGPPSAV